MASTAFADSYDDQAAALVSQMTTAEKLSLVLVPETQCPTISGGVPRLGIPGLPPTDGPIGARIAACEGTPNYPTGGTFRGATLLPSGTALGSSFDPKLAYEYGDLIGKEVRDMGNSYLVFSGNINLTREARNGRTFETPGEDPILTGIIGGQAVAGIQANNVIASLKHFALNDQETGRLNISAQISERGMRESDLLAFEIALEESDAGAVMAGYNLVNGLYNSSNNHLLNEILKGEWGFKGFVESDANWGIQSPLDANTGMDFDITRFNVLRTFPLAIRPSYFLGDLSAYVANGQVPMARLDNMVQRIVRTMLRFNLVGAGQTPFIPKLIDADRGNAVALKVAQAGTVLLKNTANLLPLPQNSSKKIAIFGSHADQAVLQGGGSARVQPIAGQLIVPTISTPYAIYNQLCPFYSIECMNNAWVLSSPKDEISALAGINATVTYLSGSDLAAAENLAAASDIAIVFVHSWQSEAYDLISLKASSGFLGMDCGFQSLADGTTGGLLNSDCVNQDELVTRVAAKNPNTIVVLETGGAVLMPWLNNVKAVLEAWYPGASGGKAIANVLFGNVNPSGKLPITFPISESNLPRPLSPAFQAPRPGCGAFCGTTLPPGTNFPNDFFTVNYDIEGQNVGYKWFDAQNLPVLFPFGHGLSYTTFRYSHLQTTPTVSNGENVIRVKFKLKNTGNRAGAEVAQVYLRLPVEGAAPKRLVGFKKVFLQPGETRKVTITLDPNSVTHPLSFWNVNDGPQGGTGAWDIADGKYKVYVGSSSRDIRLYDKILIQDKPDNHHHGDGHGHYGDNNRDDDNNDYYDDDYSKYYDNN